MHKPERLLDESPEMSPVLIKPLIYSVRGSCQLLLSWPDTMNYCGKSSGLISFP